MAGKRDEWCGSWDGVCVSWAVGVVYVKGVCVFQGNVHGHRTSKVVFIDIKKGE